MENLNIDENTMNKLKGMLNNGDLNNIISQIPPEMMQNFSNLMSNNSEVINNQQFGNINNADGKSSHINNFSSDSNSNSTSNSSFNSSNNNSANFNNVNSSNPSNVSSNMNNFDFSKIDMNMMLKMKSIMENLNSSNDPRSNLLYSLKPYLRDEKRGKIDQYANLLNFAKVAEVFKSDNKDNRENKKNE